MILGLLIGFVAGACFGILVMALATIQDDPRPGESDYRPGFLPGPRL